MSFYGTSMIFDGVACEEMGLVLYDFDVRAQEATKFSSNLSISEDRIDGRYRSLFYGGTVNEPLTFSMVMCASEDRINKRESFDRWDLQKIASWLTGHAEYKWLTIVQPDMEGIRFRCICSDLEAIEIGSHKWGLSCKVTCDSPYAYMTPEVFTYSAPRGSERQFEIFSKSTHNGFYYPWITISNHEGGNISISVTNSNENMTFSFVGLPSSVGSLTIDCENGVITTASGMNAYQYVDFSGDFKFPRFARGSNALRLSGRATYSFTCEWPVNVGG